MSEIEHFRNVLGGADESFGGPRRSFFDIFKEKAFVDLTVYSSRVLLCFAGRG